VAGARTLAAGVADTARRHGLARWLGAIAAACNQLLTAVTGRWLVGVQVEKGTQGVDGRVVNPRSKGEAFSRGSLSMTLLPH
jgi:hypothetical protein